LQTVPEDELDRAVALLGARRAVLPMVELPTVLGMPHEAAASLVDALLTAGLATLWKGPSGPAVTLSSLAAARLGLRLYAPIERRSLEAAAVVGSIRWCNPAQERPERGPRPRWEVLEADLRAGPAARPGLEAVEEPGSDPLPFYSPMWRWSTRQRFLGLSLVGWSPAIEAADPCVVCQNRRLAANEVCLGCLRTGRDWGLACVPMKERPRHYRADPHGLGGGVGAPGPRSPTASKRAESANRRPIRRRQR
jgi:hypothetical protein